MRTSIAIVFFGLLAVSCGGSGSGSGGSGAGAGGSGAGGSTSTSTSTGGNGTGGSTGGSTGGATTGGTGIGGEIVASPVVINEIHAIGEDWVELVNTGADSVDLSSYGIADSDAMGVPKIVDAARFPAGTVLGPQGRAFIVAEQDPAAGVGPHDVCLTTGGPNSCFYATWGISASKGEKLFLLAPADSVVGEAEYPPNAVLEPSTWGRLPDGTGNFAETAATPGEANKAP